MPITYKESEIDTLLKERKRSELTGAIRLVFGPSADTANGISI